ncbi:hypothetical protein niasHS_005476 [Heterodera schachtii]|uniref:Uncharacterized protein n=1 Tax=Heterodera schachtii TaxID=97005 RepID=A0ABD2JJ83_HETSC
MYGLPILDFARELGDRVSKHKMLLMRRESRESVVVVIYVYKQQKKARPVLNCRPSPSPKVTTTTTQWDKGEEKLTTGYQGEKMWKKMEREK